MPFKLDFRSHRTDTKIRRSREAKGIKKVKGRGVFAGHLSLRQRQKALGQVGRVRCQGPGPGGSGLGAAGTRPRRAARDAAGGELGERRSRDPVQPGCGFRFPGFDAMVAPPPARAFPGEPGIRLPDGGPGRATRRSRPRAAAPGHSGRSLPQVTSPAVDLKGGRSGYSVALRSFCCASLFTIVLPQCAVGSTRSETGAWHEPDTYVLHLC